MLKTRSLWNLCRLAAWILSFGLLAGCVTDPVPKKTADEDPLAKQARQMRSTSSERSGTGLCDESRDIEKDLGYH